MESANVERRIMQAATIRRDSLIAESVGHADTTGSCCKGALYIGDGAPSSYARGI